MGSMAETEVTLSEPRVRLAVTGAAERFPATGFSGAVPVPSQPRLMFPSGERRIPFWLMVAAWTLRVPPAENGSGRAEPLANEILELS
jgi:hypothetical protein